MTKPMKLARSLSYRVETRRNCFSLLKKRSMTLRALYHDVIDQIDVDEHNTSVKQSGKDPAGVVACGVSGLCPVARRGRGSIDRPIPEQVGSRIWPRSAEYQGDSGRVRSCGAIERCMRRGPGGRSLGRASILRGSLRKSLRVPACSPNALIRSVRKGGPRAVRH